CSSCHEPHNDSLGPFLRRELGESLICLECHNK
ncbi:MAG: cytochrome C, partial [Planctomycetes bacterium]|nr:cytochrome C [Planctomycetota bacterium]